MQHMKLRAACARSPLSQRTPLAARACCLDFFVFQLHRSATTRERSAPHCTPPMTLLTERGLLHSPLLPHPTLPSSILRFRLALIVLAHFPQNTHTTQTEARTHTRTYDSRSFLLCSSPVRPRLSPCLQLASLDLFSISIPTRVRVYACHSTPPRAPPPCIQLFSCVAPCACLSSW